MCETKYPLPNGCRDEIDQWLWDEMQLLPGCCSSIANMQYGVARETAERLMKWFPKEETPKDSYPKIYFNQKTGHFGFCAYTVTKNG